MLDQQRGLAFFYLAAYFTDEPLRHIFEHDRLQCESTTYGGSGPAPPEGTRPPGFNQRTPAKRSNPIQDPNMRPGHTHTRANSIERAGSGRIWTHDMVA